jgi:hypothetical protein
VIPDRLPVAIRRWDPFYATIHQVVIRPSQAQFNTQGFMLCGKAIVGRQLMPPVEMVIRDEIRASDGKINALRYRVPDHEKVREEAFLFSPGSHRRDFTLADPAEPDLWTLTLEEFEARRTDPEGPLVIANIPYFPAAVHIKGNQIHSLLCLSAQEIIDIQDELRSAHRAAELARINAEDLPAITQEAMNRLGGNPSQEELKTEIDRIIRKRLAVHMDKYRSPEPLDMALDGTLAPHLRFDLAPKEWIDLQNRGIILMDGAVRSIKGRKVTVHLRDHADWLGGGAGTRDNLLKRPRYRPSESGPVFVPSE